MKISLNWLKRLVDIPVSDEELVRLIGARLVEVEGVIDETHKYDNIYIVRVEKAEKIPDTHLTLCMVNAGDAKVPGADKDKDGLVQVLCGAPNVHEGMLAVWIAPGAIVPASVNDVVPFVIGKKKMLGKYDSNGMLAAEDELDFGEDHEGIIEIAPGSAKPGDLFADVFELNDLVLEIENKSLTHRPDCFGMIGFAREVAGILGEKFNEPDLGAEKNSGKVGTGDLKVKISSSDICKRYTALLLEKHGELNKRYFGWENTVISKAGMKPISPIVDATNYLMLLTGQPLHAFDYDKFVKVGGAKNAEVGVRLAKKGEKLVLLDDTEVDLNENDIVITSHDKPVALAGAMGGKSTMIDENTRNILLESATFSLYHLRKTQMSHGIFSEAITRFTKGQPAYQTLDVAKKCAECLADGFKVAGVVDEYVGEKSEIVIKISVFEINNLLGTSYKDSLVKQTLENVGFEVKSNGENLSITAPAWRTDIHIKEDIIEEVGRLLGYDNILPTLPMHGTADVNESLEAKKDIRELLSKYGANEVLTYSFVSEKLLEKVGQKPDNSYKIVNSISPELQYMRQSLLPNLLEKAFMNQKLPVDKFAIFEINKVFQKEWGLTGEKVPVEKTHLGFVVAERKNDQTAFYKAKKYVDAVLKSFNTQVKYEPLKAKTAEALPFEPKRSAEILTLDGEYLGVVGEFRNSVRQEFKLGEYLAGFEIDFEKVLSVRGASKPVYVGAREVRDLTVSTNGTYADLLLKVEKVLAENELEAEILPLGIYKSDKNDKKHTSMRLVFRKFDSKIMKKLENL